MDIQQVDAQRKLLIFETHPIQYRAPIFQQLQNICPDEFEVIYASDFSVRGYKDPGFDAPLSWDIPLLSGYPNRVLGTERGDGINSWRGLSGRGVFELIQKHKPKAVLVSSLSYLYNWTAIIAAKLMGAEVWMRVETQDMAFERGPVKGRIRSLIYRLLYSLIDRAFYIGELNRLHLLKHGISPSRMTPARYCTVDRTEALDYSKKENIRNELRQRLGIPQDFLCISFFGKFIEKKNPQIIFSAVERCAALLNRSVTLMMVGAGELRDELKVRAAEIEQTSGIKTIFAGFINQADIGNHYLASDMVVLPSRRMGETWGLVVNEAISSGCSAIVSDAVGCSSDFGDWERVRVFPVGDVDALAAAIIQLGKFRRQFDWAEKPMIAYSVSAAAESFSGAIRKLPD